MHGYENKHFAPAVPRRTQFLAAQQQVRGRQLQVTRRGERNGLCIQMERSEPRLAVSALQHLHSQLLLTGNNIPNGNSDIII